MNMRINRTVELIFMLFVMVTLPVIAVAHEKNAASEFLEVEVEEEMKSTDVLALLDQTVGETASSSTHPITHQLRQGLLVTAIPQGRNVILRFKVTKSDTGQHERITEVAISAELGRTFFNLVEAALKTAESIFSTQHFASPWELELHTESKSGGEAAVKVEGDETAHFTLVWELSSPDRPIDRFTVPKAFSKGEGGKENINGTVHFPITLERLIEFANRAYGRDTPERFNDFPLFPHTWLHLTVTAQDEMNRVVNVHFDAITISGERLFVAEAPASTDVGGRFIDQTVARMREMLDEEATQPGSSREWQTEFYYDDPDKGIVVVAAKGGRGLFDIVYQLETSIRKVGQDDPGAG